MGNKKPYILLILHYQSLFSTMESAEAMIVFNKYDEMMELVKK